MTKLTPEEDYALCGENKVKADLEQDFRDSLDIRESHATSGYDDISTIYAYYTPEEKAMHGKHCEHWTNFGQRDHNYPYITGKERDFIADVERRNPGLFSYYLISWSNSN
jgi:hypothetical protein